ncbi:hypothetical protein [Ciceribacter selenitireducens]
MRRKSTPNAASAASAAGHVFAKAGLQSPHDVSPTSAVLNAIREGLGAAGAAATSPAAPRKRGAEITHHACLSLAASPDIDFALSAFNFFEAQLGEQWKVVDQWEREYREGRFMGDAEGFQAWAKGTNHGFECDQQDAILTLMNALEAFIRQRKCSTVGDLVVKVRLNAFWMEDAVKNGTTDYAEEACTLVRSILPLVEALDAGSGEAV